MRREEYVLGHRPGFNLIYWQRITRTPARVERWGRLWGWTRDQIMLTKALLITRMACVFIDHIIRRMEQAELIETSLGEPHLEWENQYRNFPCRFARQSIPTARNRKADATLHRYPCRRHFFLDFATPLALD